MGGRKLTVLAAAGVMIGGLTHSRLGAAEEPGLVCQVMTDAECWYDCDTGGAARLSRIGATSWITSGSGSTTESCGQLLPHRTDRGPFGAS